MTIAVSDIGTRRGELVLVCSKWISRLPRSMSAVVRLNSSSLRKPVSTARMSAGRRFSYAVASRCSNSADVRKRVRGRASLRDLLLNVVTGFVPSHPH